MHTYTTPTITITLSGIEYYSLVDFVRIAFRGNKTIVKTVEPDEIDTEHGTASVRLTQEETAAIGEGSVSIQARVKYNDGTVTATNKVVRRMENVIDKVVI